MREREVVDLAVLGHTDEQIAHAIGISVSTVNSYWVRIRGKIGQLSRTEIVGKMIHAGYHEEHVRQWAEIDRLTKLLATATDELAGARRQIQTNEGVDWYVMALHYASEALLIIDGEGKIVYGNLQAERLFGSEPASLIGKEVCGLTDAPGRGRREERVRKFFQAETAHRLAIGIREPCYALDMDGEAFRITMVLERFVSAERAMAVVTVKEFLADVDEIVRSLRKPIALE